MELLLMVYGENYYAVDMTHVSRIVEPRREKIEESQWLLPPAGSPSGVLLKNGRLLPAVKIEKMVYYPGGPIPPNSFLRGCMTVSKFDGFVLVDGKVYGMLCPTFLKITGGSDADSNTDINAKTNID